MADKTRHPVQAWIMSNPLLLLVRSAAPAPPIAADVPGLGRRQVVVHSREPPGPCLVSGDAWPRTLRLLGRAPARWPRVRAAGGVPFHEQQRLSRLVMAFL